MSKIKKLNKNKAKLDMEKVVMGKIKSDEIKMKPKWLFVLGSTFIMAGLVGLTVGAIFLTNLTIFIIKKRGPGYGRLDLMLNSFPIWIPILAVLGVILGIWMLKKYDFSYKKNFVLIILSFIASVIIAGLLVDQLGLNTIWSHQGPMRMFYQQFQSPQDNSQKVRENGRLYNIHGNGY
ncbi:hypothetical protein A2W13_02015 [Candidatus Woesebacteria bacterium RBG_16_36_11]|uniref:Uncharacterized protein n=2 Tax=Candidatus Woeseibacteriota TaxID=1752722 RepID=A0A1F7XBK1_9BACT|nr:MAG: hypothetical protein A2W13_02015 [Candidatus Woesebacteria bacterium RBG_16_36_11]OGM17008.1 MAG: hypothetical protein A2V55_01990 [Candidatus Woesebacteria bacterium RBG_19FT_COMBO_37_29]